MNDNDVKNFKISSATIVKKSQSIKKILKQAQLDGIKSKLNELNENFNYIEKQLSGFN